MFIGQLGFFLFLDRLLCTYPLVYHCKVYTAQEIPPERAPQILEAMWAFNKYGNPSIRPFWYSD